MGLDTSCILSKYLVNECMTEWINNTLKKFSLFFLTLLLGPHYCLSESVGSQKCAGRPYCFPCPSCQRRLHGMIHISTRCQSSVPRTNFKTNIPDKKDILLLWTSLRCNNGCWGNCLHLWQLGCSATHLLAEFKCNLLVTFFPSCNLLCNPLCISQNLQW